MTLSLASLDVGLTLSGLNGASEAYLRSDAPLAKIPECRHSDAPGPALLTFASGPSEFRADTDNRRYSHGYDGVEPRRNLISMARTILERLHQERGRYSLHSSSFEKDGKGVLAIGESAAGKTSLLLSAMLERGYRGIGGEQCLISSTDIAGGTKSIAFYTGLAGAIPELKDRLKIRAPGWGRADRLRMPLSDLGDTLPSAPISLLVFPLISDQKTAEVLYWSPRKRLLELYGKMTETIRGANALLFDNTQGFPSLDTDALSRSRLEAASSIVATCAFVVVKGNRLAILDVIDRELESR